MPGPRGAVLGCAQCGAGPFHDKCNPTGSSKCPNCETNGLKPWTAPVVAVVRSAAAAAPISAEEQLWAAAQAGAAGTVGRLLDQGTKLDLANKNGWSALFFASASDSIGTSETVKLLLERGVNIHTMDRYGFTALQLAAFSSHTEVVAQLLDEGADVEASKPDGATPLVLAAANCQTEVRQVDIVLDHFSRFSQPCATPHAPCNRLH